MSWPGLSAWSPQQEGVTDERREKKRSARGDGEVSGRKLYQQGPEGFRAAKKSSPRLVPGASRERKKGG